MLIEARCFTVEFGKRVNVLMTEVEIWEAFDPKKTESFPESKKFMAIWDPGATNTSITQRVIDECGLKPSGMIKLHHIAGSTTTQTFLVNIGLPNKVLIPYVRVAKAKGFIKADVLIGMDIIGMGDFAVTNKDRKTVFSFRVPSIECIDFLKLPDKK